MMIPPILSLLPLLSLFPLLLLFSTCPCPLSPFFPPLLPLLLLSLSFPSFPLLLLFPFLPLFPPPSPPSLLPLLFIVFQGNYVLQYLGNRLRLAPFVTQALVQVSHSFAVYEQSMNHMCVDA